MQDIFNNREIAIGILVVALVTIPFLFKASRKDFIKAIYIFFGFSLWGFHLTYLTSSFLAVYFLHNIGFWDMALLKDTLIWIIFIQIPLSIKAVEKAKDGRFFTDLLRDVFSAYFIFQYIVNFWTFSLLWEIVIQLLLLVFGIVYVVANAKKEISTAKVMGVFNAIIGFVLLIFVVLKLFTNSSELLNMFTFKELILPALMLLMNIPSIYGLAVYSKLQQTFRIMEMHVSEPKKMKMRILLFSRFNLKKLQLLRTNIFRIVNYGGGTSDLEVRQKLKMLSEYIDNRIGDNYMKRSNFYITAYAILTGICLLGIFSLSSFNLKEVQIFKFNLDLSIFMLYVLPIMLSASVCFLIYSVGIKMKKNEDLSKIKKFALNDLLFLIQRQKDSIIEDNEFKSNPDKLFLYYVYTALKIKKECDRSIIFFENLLNSWELELFRKLQSKADGFIHCFGDEVFDCSADEFIALYNKKLSSSMGNDGFNFFVYSVDESLSSYLECVEEIYELFQPCFD